jgi:ABC-type glycerol-3-phosphate transport system permease component
MTRPRVLAIHLVLIVAAFVTLLPFAFVVNNIFRSNSEFHHHFFAVPQSFKGLAEVVRSYAAGDDTAIEIRDLDGTTRTVTRSEAARHHWRGAARGPQLAWEVLRGHMVNSMFVSILTALGVSVLGSSTAHILARYRFMGGRAVFVMFLATMMFPGVLTLVPSFLLVKSLGLLNTYWAMILPYVAGGQVFAIFVFRSFVASIPEELFESARLDGAGHVRLYLHIILPLSRPAFSVVIIMSIIGTWNNFLWPFITNTDGTHHVIASGLYVMANSPHAANVATLYAAYAISSIPLLILFVYATRPFLEGLTRGALKA